MTNLDVLIVYSSNTAISAESNSKSIRPFSIDSQVSDYNLPYSYFLQSCGQQGMRAGLCASEDVIGPGSCQNYWTSAAGKWTKVRSKARSTQIFDKISPSSPKRIAERNLLLSTKNIQAFNNPELFNTFFDKLQTYERLPRYSVPTVAVVSATARSIKQSLQSIEKLILEHPHSADFLPRFVLKDRYGAGGNHVYAVEKQVAKIIQTILRKNPDVQFVLQPFLAFDKGFVFNGSRTSTDIRLIFHHNEILQSYLRVAQEDEFRCNEHQGAELFYIAKRDIPLAIRKAARTIVTNINHPSSLYALDFVVSNTGQVYLIEGNFGPGLDWNVKKKINETKSKELIDSIIAEFSARILRARDNQLSNA